MAIFSDLPLNVKDRIFSYFFHHEPAIIHDLPVGSIIVAAGTGQTTYETAEGRTTYFALSTCRIRQEIHQQYQFTSYTGLATRLLQVNREWYNIGVGHLYNRTFAFAGSANSCLAFLHDHRRAACRIARCTIFLGPAASYTWQEFIEESPSKWRDHQIEDSTHSADRRAFAQELATYIKSKHQQRDNITVRRTVGCAARRLEASCYWLKRKGNRRRRR
ncbi:hypothetical protein EJ03DRAFT_334454 [Teratosphaeria nubilosa]|uniref:Uncharacterized protein n=1 Tax=Teratosphaeria nubilosa TaxID=161662 RepID=A0A6G1LG82_9PEZI|nr:hypothetical protein EJ03DRAFT_334454 [Teratosphaeria nubilosa]